MIIDTAKECGYYEAILDNLKYRLSQENGKWCKMKSHPSGRDFYDPFPIEYLSDDEIDQLKEEVLDDVYCDYETFETDFTPILNEQEVKEEMETAGFRKFDLNTIKEYCEDALFEMAFDQLIRENQS